MLLSALIVKAYFRSNGKSEAQATTKAREWPTSSNAQRTAVRQSYLDIVTRNNANWRGQFLNDALRALQADVASSRPNQEMMTRRSSTPIATMSFTSTPL